MVIYHLWFWKLQIITNIKKYTLLLKITILKNFFFRFQKCLILNPENDFIFVLILVLTTVSKSAIKSEYIQKELYLNQIRFFDCFLISRKKH